jgi:soluble lytic murein transglycosylase-like protein
MKAFAPLILALVAVSCAHSHGRFFATARLNRLPDFVRMQPYTIADEPLAGAAPLHDGGAAGFPELAITRAVLHTNPRVDPMTALHLAVRTTDAARAGGLPPEFLAATLLQESAYDAGALSSAGAIGIAQFMPSTASEMGIDPRDPDAAIGGAARLLRDYVTAYDGRYDDNYAAALAAYNAGPGAVAKYRGVPPYPETRDYIDTIFDRWARIRSYERPPRDSRH